jgi:hypothetical protein
MAADRQGDRYIPFNIIYILYLTNMGNLAMVWEDGICRSPKAPDSLQVRFHLMRLSPLFPCTSADGSAAVGMIWWNYRLCVTTNPGSVPDGYVRLPLFYHP